MLNPNLNYPGNGFKIKQLLGTLALGCGPGLEASLSCRCWAAAGRQQHSLCTAAHQLAAAVLRGAHSCLQHMHSLDTWTTAWGTRTRSGISEAREGCQVQRLLPAFSFWICTLRLYKLVYLPNVICAVYLCWNFCWFCSVRKRLATSKIGSFNRFHFLLKNATPPEQISLSRGSGKFRNKILYLLN